MRRFYLTLFAILTIVALNSSSSFAYEKELKSISTNMSEKIAKAGKKTVAVVDFTDLQGNVTELGRFIAEEFSVALADADKGFEIVDRTHLQTLLKEHKLSTTGIIDPSTAKKLGEIAGVDALVTGTITPFGDSVRISIKILDTSTAKVIGASSGEIAKTKAIEELLARGIEIGSQTTTRTSVREAPVSTSSQAKSQYSVTVKDFLFELQSCRLSGQTVDCSLLVTNKADNDESLSISDSRIFDDSGNEFSVTELKLGNRGSNNTLISGIPTKANVMFEVASSLSDRIALLELSCYSKGNFKVQIRNIPLSK